LTVAHEGYAVAISHELSSRATALLIDYPVLLRAVRATALDTGPRLSLIVARARALGPLLVARAYGAWYDLEEARGAFTEGVDPVFVPPVSAGSVPTTTALVADGLALIRAGQIRALALSGDDRMLPLVAAAHAAKLEVALIAHSCAPDGPCLKLADVAEPVSAFTRGLSRAGRYRRTVA
jgi:hypothetical protein